LQAEASGADDSLTDPGTQPIEQRGANYTIKVQLIKTVVVADGSIGEPESHARLHDRKREIQNSRKGKI
jgi:hypothetical protein